ncbi:MAG TPA: hypothetical protein VFS43_35385 [Polyangiaceae bacterium]|nr:hypothetical protein [Polyangiaceae bacterium]
MAAARLSITYLKPLEGSPNRFLVRASFDGRPTSFVLFFLDEALDSASFDDDGWAFVDGCRKGGYPFAACQVVGVARGAARGRVLAFPIKLTPFDTTPAAGAPPAASGAC